MRTQAVELKLNGMDDTYWSSSLDGVKERAMQTSMRFHNQSSETTFDFN